MSTPWSKQAWKAAEPAYQLILKLPFLTELADGSLPRQKFDFYIGQDSLYLNDYSRVLAHIASRINDRELTEAFLKFASDGVEVEKCLHAQFVDQVKAEKSPTCLFYTSLLRAQATEDVAIEAAAILPCFWVYRQVGRETLRIARMEGNPYAAWIRTYADESFDRSTNLAIDICNRLAERVDADTRHRMTQIFLKATVLEYRFWQSAYCMESWNNFLTQ